MDFVIAWDTLSAQQKKGDNMKKMVLIALTMFVGFTAGAMDCKGFGNECEGVKAVIEVLNSDKSSEEAKQLLVKALAIQSEDETYAIIENEIVNVLKGKITRSIKVGYDDLNDDDSGWSSVYEILVQSELDISGKETIVAVTLTPIAG